MASNFNQARVSNRLATEALASRNRAKERAATVNPGRDVNAENAARVRSGSGPWAPGHGDETFAANTSK